MQPILNTTRNEAGFNCDPISKYKSAILIKQSVCNLSLLKLSFLSPSQHGKSFTLLCTLVTFIFIWISAAMFIA